MASKPLWACPKCGRKFANRNQSHACGQYTVQDFLQGKSPDAVRLFRRFVARVRDCGPVLIAPAKTRIGFQVRMIFAAVNRLGEHGLDAHVVLTRRLDHPRFRRIEQLTPTCVVHHFRITTTQDIDDQVGSWLREAYRVGKQERLE
jgi:hypothetical protein